jgi:hypothetical protein
MKNVKQFLAEVKDGKTVEAMKAWTKSACGEAGLLRKTKRIARKIAKLVKLEVIKETAEINMINDHTIPGHPKDVLIVGDITIEFYGTARKGDTSKSRKVFAYKGSDIVKPVAQGQWKEVVKYFKPAVKKSEAKAPATAPIVAVKAKDILKPAPAKTAAKK